MDIEIVSVNNTTPIPKDLGTSWKRRKKVVRARRPGFLTAVVSYRHDRDAAP